jgi:hypothetical protein
MRGLRGALAVLIPVGLVLTIAACSRSSSPARDQQIVTDIDATLYQNPELKPLGVSVTSDHGIVTLKGQVNAPLEKLAIEDIAGKTQGVKQVVDDLTVSPPASAQAGASESSAEPAKSTASEQPVARAARRRRHIRKRAEVSQPAQVADDQPAPSAADSSAASPAPTAAPAALPPQAPPSPPPPPPPQQVTIPAETVVTVQTIDSVSSGTATAGQELAGSLAGPIVVGNQVIAPQGADVQVRVVQAQSAGHFEGQPLLKLELAGLKIQGTRYSVTSSYYEKKAPSRGKNTAEKVGGGAVLGTLLGAIIGHGKGAGIGAAVGAGAGTADQAATHAKDVTIPSETTITFTLKAPLTVTVNPSQ